MKQAGERDGGVIGFRALKQIIDEHDGKVNTKTMKEEPASSAKHSPAVSSANLVTSAYRRELKIENILHKTGSPN